jgi:hypothetical protein
MGAPGTVTCVVRERGRGDADVVGVEERNEHDQREMGGSKCERWDGARLLRLWARVSASACAHARNTIAGAGPLGLGSLGRKSATTTRWLPD